MRSQDLRPADDSQRSQRAPLESPRIVVVIPAYRVTQHLGKVIAGIGPEISRVFVIEDGCPESSGALTAERINDSRLALLRHDRNRGVGAAVVTGYRAALQDGADIIVKIDGDGQMDPRQIERLVEPLRRGLADYTKGNRFASSATMSQMPWIRIAANTVVSLLSKASSGYWRIMDPANGFTAIRTEILAKLPLDELDRGFFFESDMLFQLNRAGATVKDIPVSVSYGEERSNLVILHEAVRFPLKYTDRFWRRLSRRFY